MTKKELYRGRNLSTWLAVLMIISFVAWGFSPHLDGLFLFGFLVGIARVIVWEIVARRATKAGLRFTIDGTLEKL